MDNDSTGNTAQLSPDEAAQQRAKEEDEWRAAAEAQAQQLVASNNEVAAWWASLPAGRGPVGGEPTGLLSLEERADRGLLADNPDWLPAQEELPLDDVLWLECPTDTDGRSALAAHIRAAVNVGKLVTDPDKPGVMQREAYRDWRAQCPNSLLPESSVIAAWTGEHLPVSVSEPPPEPVAKPGKRRHDDVLTLAIRAAIAVLSPSDGALPRAPALLNYLLQNSGRGNKFPDLNADGKSLLWTADNGSRKNTDVLAIAERLRRWKD